MKFEMKSGSATELLVQQYLRTGKSLEDLRLEHGVKSHVQNGKISLSYDQIEAKESDPLSQQCRGLILREKTFDIVACPMFRFFNLEQTSIIASIDWKSAVFEEKLDGTCLICYYDDRVNQWYCATRSRSEADVPLDDTEFTFSYLANMAIQKMFGLPSIQLLMESKPISLRSKTIVMELCSPYNRIVCDYPEPSLTLLAVRDLPSMLEEDPGPTSVLLNIPVAKTYSNKNIYEMIEIIKQWNPKEHEGIVVKDKQFNRLKVKNPAYVALNHMRDSLSTSIRGCVEIILLGKDDDVIGMLPEFITNRILKLKPSISTVIKTTNADYLELKHIDDMKIFALSAQTKLWPAALFALKRGKTSDLMTFAMGNGKGVGGQIPQSNLDQMISLCKKIDPTVGTIEQSIENSITNISAS